jgi:hypothetical protein
LAYITSLKKEPVSKDKNFHFSTNCWKYDARFMSLSPISWKTFQPRLLPSVKFIQHFG